MPRKNVPLGSGSLWFWWKVAAIVTMVFGFSVLIGVTVEAYRKAPPIPARVVDAAGAVLFTSEATNLHREWAKSGAYVCPWRWSGRKEVTDGDANDANVESPEGLSPPGAPRTVHDPLESHGSRCSAVAMT